MLCPKFDTASKLIPLRLGNQAFHKTSWKLEFPKTNFSSWVLQADGCGIQSHPCFGILYATNTSGQGDHRVGFPLNSSHIISSWFPGLANKPRRKGRTTVSPNHKHMTGTRYQFRKDTDRIWWMWWEKKSEPCLWFLGLVSYYRMELNIRNQLYRFIGGMMKLLFLESLPAYGLRPMDISLISGLLTSATMHRIFTGRSIY